METALNVVAYLGLTAADCANVRIDMQVVPDLSFVLEMLSPMDRIARLTTGNGASGLTISPMEEVS